MYAIYFDYKESKWTHWLSLVIYRNTAVYFDSFEIKGSTQDALNKIKGKSMTRNIFRMLVNDSIMCG